jgi:3-dehydroquinate synthase
MQNIYINRFPSKFIYGEHKCFILTTKKIYKRCKLFNEGNSTASSVCKIIYAPEGESSKNINVALKVLDVLYKNKASKNDLFICLGGGVITDLGGFCASVYKRGMRLVLVPTTLLGMVDAAIGGKNGLNFKHAKNIIGTVFFPESVIVKEEFLSTLPEDEFLNGLSEIFKIALVRDEKFYYQLCSGYYKKNISRTIRKAIQLKKEITDKDPYEKHIRKVLNFGHTLGHAIEAHYQRENKTVAHGKAVATGMVLEIFLSLIKGQLNEITSMEIINSLSRHLKLLPDLPPAGKLFPYLMQDKKSKKNKILCVGLKQVGIPQIDLELTQRDLKKILILYSLWVKKLR